MTYEQIVARGFGLYGSEGDDVIYGSEESDRIWGYGGDDILVGMAGDDVIEGGTGNDHLDGGVGGDAMAGGMGNDTYRVDSEGDQVMESVDEGIDTVISSIDYIIGANVENLTLDRPLSGALPRTGTGNGLDNRIFGNDRSNTLHGLAGNDWLDGGRGADVLVGGAGNDTYGVDTRRDKVRENANEGVDIVRAGMSYILPKHVENLVLTGEGNNFARGNALDNLLVGNSGRNILQGRAGNDVLDGGAGNDRLDGGAGNDVYRFARGYGQDIISSHDRGMGERDVVQLESSITPADVTVARGGHWRSDDLLLRINGTQDQLTIDDYFRRGGRSGWQIEEIRFADGTVWDGQAVKAMAGAMIHEDLNGTVCDGWHGWEEAEIFLLSLGSASESVAWGGGKAWFWGFQGEVENPHSTMAAIEPASSWHPVLPTDSPSIHPLIAVDESSRVF